MRRILLALAGLVWVGTAVAAPPGSSAPGILPGAPVDSNTVLGRTLANRASDLMSVYDFSAVCDGVADDTSKIVNAAAAGAFLIPGKATRCKTTYANALAVPGGFTGPGQIVAQDGSLTAPYFTHLSSQPTTTNWGSVLSAFKGDLSQAQVRFHLVDGADTLGAPSTGYTQLPETSAQILYVRNASGKNGVGSTSGRTGSAGVYGIIEQVGGGDYTYNQCFGRNFAPGVTGWGQNLPIVACFTANAAAYADGQGIELRGDNGCKDNGYDVLCQDQVTNYYRNKAVESFGVNWVGKIDQSLGAMPIDYVHRVVGPIAAGVDYSGATMGIWRLASLALSNAGSGYTVGDVFTPMGGTPVQTGAGTRIRVTGVTVGGSTSTDAGAVGPVATYEPLTGMYSTPPFTGYASLPVTGGTGTGVAFAGAYDANLIMLLPSAGGCIKPGQAGEPATKLTDVYGRLCLDKNGLAWGPITYPNTHPTTPGGNNAQIGEALLIGGNNHFQYGKWGTDESQAGPCMWLANGNFSRGSAQQRNCIFIGTSGANTTPVRLTSNANAADGQNSLLILARTVHNITWKATARNTNGDTAVWKMRSGMVYRNATGNAAAYQGDGSTALAPDYSAGTVTGATITISTDTTLNNLNMSFTPPTGNTFVWQIEFSVLDDETQK